MQIIAIAISLAITAVAVVLTTRAVASMVATMRVGGQPALGRTDAPVRRTLTMFKETFLHTRMLQRRWVGVMHWFVYAAFLVLATAVATGFVQIFDPEFALPIIGHFFLFEWLQEGLGVLGTIGIVFLIIYRQVFHPRRLGRQSRFYGSTQWQAYFVEVMALLEGSAILFIRGAEYNLGKLASDHPEDFDRFHFPVSSFVGDALYPNVAGSEQSLENIIIVVATIKIVLAMIWLIVIASNLTMGVAWHRFTAWPNIWFKRESSGRTALGGLKPLTSGGKVVTLDDLDDLDEDSVLGVGKIEDFSWKGILDFTTCTECGRCQAQCPAWNTEKPLSPKLLITGLRDAAYAKAPLSKAVRAHGEDGAATVALLESDETLAREAERPLVGDTGDDWFYMPDSGAAVIDPDVLWSCTSCGACVQQCPVDIEHVDHIVDMRRYQLLVESNFPAELNGLFKGLENKGNPWNMSPNARLDWAKGLDFEVKVVGEDVESLDEVDWLFWVGCAGAYEDRAKKTTRAVAELLDMAGVSFAVLGNGETCTGDPARRAGNEFVFQGLAQQNVETLTEYKVKKVVSTCAHCFNTLKNEYKDFGIELEVVHHTQLLNRLVREGRLTPVKDGVGAEKRSITYHDPCYIGRHNGVYSPPRELLQVLPGAEYKEMERNSEKSFCCGAGGARMWMEEKIGERININRTNEAIGTGADQIAVGCPFCRVMLSDGLTAAQDKGTAGAAVEVLDVAQMLLASVKGERATKLAPGETVAAPAAKKADKPVETKAEPEAGDVTITEDTVTETADAGPLAKASGGSSLFDTADATEEEPSSAGRAASDSERVETKAGGSLFDSGSGGSSLFDTPSEPEPSSTGGAASASESAEAKAEPAAGGSLFDLGGDEPEAPAAKPEPETKAEPAPSASKPAEAKADLGSGGSLFDLVADEPEAPAAKAEPSSEPEPAAETAGRAASASERVETKAEPETTAAPSAEIPSGGSLFDITAPEPAPTPEPAAEPEPTPEPEPEPEPAGRAASASERVETTASQPAPAAEIPTGGSLFDIAAPAAVSAPAAPAAPADAPVEQAPADAAVVAAPATADAPADQPVENEAPTAASTEPEAAAEPATDAEAPVEETTAEEPEDQEPEEQEPEAEAKPAPAAPSGPSHQPRTDVEIGGGSLFDL